MSDIDNKQPSAEMKIDEQAARWLVRINCDTCSAADVADHKAWLDANLMHRRAYLRLESLWGDLGKYSNEPEIATLRQQAKTSGSAEVVHLIRPTNQLQESKLSKPTSSKRRKWLPTALAASVMVAIVSLGLVQQVDWSEPSQNYIYQTAVGEQKTILLPDGSELTLDTQTRLRAYFSDQERSILLEQGQARFDVAHDKDRPFVVSAGKGTITALGTAFVVRKEENEVLVTLLEGRVEVVQQELPALISGVDREPAFLPVQRRELTVGQQVAYSNQGIAEKEPVDVDQVIAWQEGRLIYEDQPLVEVIEDLNRYSKRKILLGNESLEAIRVNGVFKPGNDGTAIQALASYFSMQVTSDALGNLVLLPEAESLK